MQSVFSFFENLPSLNTGLPGIEGFRDEVLFQLVLGFSFVLLLFEVIKHDFSHIFNKIESYWLGNKFISRILRWTVYCVSILIIIYFSGDNQEFVYTQF
jgi:predicted membrane protein